MVRRFSGTESAARGFSLTHHSLPARVCRAIAAKTEPHNAPLGPCKMAALSNPDSTYGAAAGSFPVAVGPASNKLRPSRLIQSSQIDIASKRARNGREKHLLSNMFSKSTMIVAGTRRP